MTFFKSSRTYQIKNPLPVRYPEGIVGARANADAIEALHAELAADAEADARDLRASIEFHARARVRRPDPPSHRFGRSLVDEERPDELEPRAEELP